MIVGSGDVNLTQNAYKARLADDAARDALEKATDAEAEAEKAWYLSSTVLTSADGKNKNFYGMENPENPSEGDLWYVYDENGIPINMLRYRSGQWVAEVDLSDALAMIKQAEDISKSLDTNNTKFETIFTNVTDLLNLTDDQNTKIANIKASVDGLQTTVSELEMESTEGLQSQITQLSNQIDLKVSKGDVISQINVEADSATIKSKAITLAGDTTVLGTFTVPAAQVTGRLTSNQISVSSLSALTSNLGNVTAGYITGVTIDVSTELKVGNTIKLGTNTPNATKKLWFNDLSYIEGTSVSGSYWLTVQSYLVDIVSQNEVNEIAVSNDGIILQSGKNEISVWFYGSGTNTLNVTNGRVQADRGFYTNQGFYYGGTNIDSIYWKKGSSSGALSSNVYVTATSIAVGGTFDNSDTTNPTTMSIGANSMYVPSNVYVGTKVYTKGVALTSDMEIKKNIEPYLGYTEPDGTFKTALDQMLELQFMTYNFKGELDNEKKHLGLILQDASYDMLDPEGAIDIYAMTSLFGKAVQEIYDKFSKRLDYLESKIA